MRVENLSVWSSMFIEQSPEEMVDTLIRCGFSATELSYEHAAKLLERGSVPEAGGAFRRLIDGKRFRIPQAHLDFVTCDPVAVDPAERRRNLDSLKEQIELFAILGVRAMVLHAGGRNTAEANWSREQVSGVALDGLRELGKCAEKFGVFLCLENMYGSRYDLLPQKSSGDLLALIERIGSPHYAVCLDTGHLALSKAEEPETFIRNCGSRLKALHIADNFGEKDDHRLPYIGNSVDWKKVAAALREIGYSSLLNYEIPGERGCPPEILEAKTRFALALGKTIFCG